MTRRQARATEVGELRQEARDLIRRLREARMVSAGKLPAPKPAAPPMAFTADAAIVDLARGTMALPGEIYWADDADIDLVEPDAGSGIELPETLDDDDADAAPAIEIAAEPALDPEPAPETAAMAAAANDPATVEATPAAIATPPASRLRISPAALGIQPVGGAERAIAITPAEPARPAAPTRRSSSAAMDGGALGLQPLIGGPGPVDMPPAAPAQGRRRANMAAALGLDPMIEPALRRPAAKTATPVPATDPVVKPAKDQASAADAPHRAVSASAIGLTSLGGEEQFVQLAAADEPALPVGPDPALVGLEPIGSTPRQTRSPRRLPPRTSKGMAVAGLADAPVAATARQADLSLIPSLGPGLIWRLKAIGISSIQDLAEADPEGLRRALGNIGRLVRPADWVLAAKDHLAASPERTADRPSGVTRAIVRISEGLARPLPGVRVACIEAPDGSLVVVEGAAAAVLLASAELFAASGKSATLIDCRSGEAGILGDDWLHLPIDAPVFDGATALLPQRALSFITGGAA